MARLFPIPSALLLAASLTLAAGCAGHRSADPGPEAAKATYRVTAPLLNLLDCPSLTCPVLEDLRTGDAVTVMTVIPGGWAQVRAQGSGREGFVLLRYLGR